MGDLFASLQARTPSTHTLAGGGVDAQAWTRANLSEKDWLVPLSATCLAELKRVVQALRQEPEPVTNPSPSQFSLIECTQLMSRVQDKLQHGPGIAIVDRIRLDDFSAEENRAVYWLLASMIAPIVPQKCDGTMIYDVKDSRKTLAYGVRRSVTNLAQEFHTDGGWLAMPPEFMGLFCLQTAEHGGESRFVSLVKVHAEMQRRHPILLHRLHQPFYWDRQAEHPPNEAKVSVYPVFSYDGQPPFARYYEDYILKGYELAGAHLVEQGFAALKAMREIVDSPGMCIDFSLEPGQIQFLNNYHFAHSRTGFTDSDTSGKRRHLLRLPDDQVLTLTDYVDALQTRVPGLIGGDLQLATEFGRFIQAGCGWAVSRVEYIKKVADRRTAVIQLGADFLMRPVYQSTHWRHRYIVLDRRGRPKSGSASRWTIVGPLCFAGDILAPNAVLPEIEAGDLLMVCDVGAYTLSMWSRHCSRGIPMVVGYTNGHNARFRVLRARETPQDVAQFWGLAQDQAEVKHTCAKNLEGVYAL